MSRVGVSTLVNVHVVMVPPLSLQPLCDNHDDGETQALILCEKCGNLCGECDRVLHYRRATKSHQRQVRHCRCTCVDRSLDLKSAVKSKNVAASTLITHSSDLQTF